MAEATLIQGAVGVAAVGFFAPAASRFVVHLFRKAKSALDRSAPSSYPVYVVTFETPRSHPEDRITHPGFAFAVGCWRAKHQLSPPKSGSWNAAQLPGANRRRIEAPSQPNGIHPQTATAAHDNAVTSADTIEYTRRLWEVSQAPGRAVISISSEPVIFPLTSAFMSGE